MFKILLALGLQLSAADFASAVDLQVIHAAWLLPSFTSISFPRVNAPPTHTHRSEGSQVPIYTPVGIITGPKIYSHSQLRLCAVLLPGLSFM